MKQRLVVGLALVLFALALLWLGPARPRAPAHLLDQVWVERMPRSETDMIRHFVALGEEPFGAVGRSSQWRLAIDLFRYRLEGDVIDMHLPQADEKLRLVARTWRCKGRAPEPFELCLELKSRRSSLTFYSREEWHLEGGAVPAELAHLVVEPRGRAAAPLAAGGFVDGALPRALLGE